MLVIATEGFFDKDENAGGRGANAAKNKELDDSAFTSMADRHAELMYRVAFSLLRNGQEAEDVVQEVFLKLYRTAGWRQMNNEKAFLARAVWRVALDRLPRFVPQSLDVGHEQFADKGDSPEAQVIRKAQAEHLRKLIDSLPANLRHVLVLSAIEELNSREVGLLVGIPEGTVRTRLRQARQELRRRFDATGKGKGKL